MADWWDALMSEATASALMFGYVAWNFMRRLAPEDDLAMASRVGVATVIAVGAFIRAVTHH